MYAPQELGPARDNDELAPSKVAFSSIYWSSNDYPDSHSMWGRNMKNGQRNVCGACDEKLSFKGAVLNLGTGNARKQLWGRLTWEELIVYVFLMKHYDHRVADICWCVAVCAVLNMLSSLRRIELTIRDLRNSRVRIECSTELQ